MYLCIVSVLPTPMTSFWKQTEFTAQKVITVLLWKRAAAKHILDIYRKAFKYLLSIPSFKPPNTIYKNLFFTSQKNKNVKSTIVLIG